jgi:DNA-nicking Smr family endonuclease
MNGDEAGPPGDEDNPRDEGDPVEIPIDGVLDLHQFQPGDVRDLVPHYLELCREKGILRVRIIHGKGTGALKRSVLSILSKLPGVVSYKTAMEDEGGWGATIVTLEPPDGSIRTGS